VGTVHARRIHGPEDYVRHAGEEFAYVLSGEIEVHFENGEVVRMARGDSLYFDSRLGHAYISVSRQLARIVGMTIGESGHMQSAREAPALKAPARKAAPAKKKTPARRKG
jgi:uncharacterized cupin superfamily protein